MRQRSRLHVGSTTQAQADSNDILVVIRRDGDVVLDEKVRNEYGLLNSDAGEASIIGAQPATEIAWTTLDAGGIPVGGAYVIDQEQPKHNQIGRFMRGSLREQYTATTALKTAKQKRDVRNQNIAYWAVATLCVIVILIGFVLLPMWNTYQVRQVVEGAQQNPIVAPTPMPTRTPLPTLNPTTPAPGAEPESTQPPNRPIPRSRQ